MKYIKTYETKEKFSEYSGLVVLTIPSETYFKSETKFILQFVDEVYRETLDNWTKFNNIKYDVNGYTFTRIETQKGEEYYSVMYESFSYSENEFNRLKFMTMQEFYKKYPDSFVKILEIMIDKLKNSNLTNDTKDVYNMIINKLTIPETEYIISANKYNL